VRRLALPIAVAALLALAGLVVVEVLRPAASPTQTEQALALARELRCPDCQALSVAESQTSAAAAIRRQIVEQLAAGKTPDQVRAYFVRRYGDWILLEPSSALAWWVPPAVLLLGVGILAWWLRRAPGAATPPSAGADAGVREQISNEVEQLDA
jgi:cytochrome c-type biogenesis protein CcmH